MCFSDLPIKGGVGDKSTVDQFDRDQLKAGIKVEMEHTDDPIVALDIVLDHLSEKSDYYGDNGEACSACNAQKDIQNEEINKDVDDQLYPKGWREKDKRMTSPDLFKEPDNDADRLLGYKPNNVGDYQGLE